MNTRIAYEHAEERIIYCLYHYLFTSLRHDTVIYGQYVTPLTPLMPMIYVNTLAAEAIVAADLQYAAG